MKANLDQLKDELHLELTHILQYWMTHARDEEHGGFFGKIDNDNKADGDAKKGLVLNARILWTFSAAYIHTNEEKYRSIAGRSYQYLIDYFLDKHYGGFYWSVDKEGKAVEDKKQVYGIAFCLYGFAEYYKATRKEEALQKAKDCYAWIEQYSFDKDRGGYLEAFTRNWQPVDDLRLSVQDANEKKTMNTHLHVLEAYTNLYKVWKDEDLRLRIKLLLENFSDHIIDRDNGHLNLFFDENWRVKADVISYGHDIEAAWLLQEAADTIDEKMLCDKIKGLSVKLANAAADGLDKDGGLWYETAHGDLVKQKHWWPQAEAMVGFFNAWQLTGDETYLQHVLQNWKFIQQYIRDKKNGEWFWGVYADGSIMQKEDKAGFWKCPYHNGRACIEISKRIKEINN